MRRLYGITVSMDMSLNQLGVGDGQGSMICCIPWGRKELDTTEQLNLTECFIFHLFEFKVVYIHTEAWHQVVYLNKVLI